MTLPSNRVGKLVEQLKEDEGFSEKSFWDNDQWTWGYGTKAPGKDMQITKDQAQSDLVDRVYIAISDLYAVLGDDIIDKIDETRQLALANMIYNIGRTKFSNFKMMLLSIRMGDWTMAAFNARNSRWYNQVGKRAERICREIQYGDKLKEVKV